MWSLVVFSCLLVWVEAQNGRSPGDNGWDIRLAVPGEPGNDYPVLNNIPRTSFSCSGKSPGYYSDVETNCQVFRVCTLGSTYSFQSFLCPNGTLFNQAVFVCDWWMNVNCHASQQIINNNNERFSNLRLGPKLMNDIKKMITHPMRNPYDRSVMKSNVVIMQEYKPPSGQFLSNGVMSSYQERPLGYYAAKLTLPYNGDNRFSASSPRPQYVPASFNSFANAPQANEVQRNQKQRAEYGQSIKFQPGTNIVIGQTNQYSQAKTAALTNNANARLPQPTQTYNEASNIRTTQNAIDTQSGQLNKQNSQYTDGKNPYRFNSGKPEIGISFAKPQYNYNSNQQKQPYTYTANEQPQVSNELRGQEAKQNLVSNNVPSTVITKTLTYNRIIQNPKPGRPRSRITFKTWIVKPKSEKLVASPTAYTYDKPTRPPTQKLVDSTTPYYYNKPTVTTELENIVSESGYVYDKPTPPAKIITTPSRLYLNPTTPPPTLNRIYLPPSLPPPTISSNLYLPPTTFKPTGIIIIPQNPAVLSRQYLSPIQQPPLHQGEQLRASPTTPTPVYAIPDSDSFTLLKRSRINTNLNNLTFTDILTKEKLDITVNDIVSDTSKLLKTASPQNLGQYRDNRLSVDYPEETYLPPEESTESDEALTSQTPTIVNKSSRLISTPSTELEPPVESFNVDQNLNRLSNLPFLKEPTIPTNTIERTVSLKISIPERIAAYLFTNRTEPDNDRLEILNTGSSNYLVLNQLKNNHIANLIPIGRLIQDRNSNISNSQALVFSFLTDSLNQAKDYTVLAEQNLPQPSSHTEFQNINSEELARLSNTVSQLTSSQYSRNSDKKANLLSAPTITPTSFVNQYNSNIHQNQLQQSPNAQYNAAPQQQTSQGQLQQTPNAQYNAVPQQQTSQGRYPATSFQSNNPQNLQNSFNQKQLITGQIYRLPSPAPGQIYNGQNSANLGQSNGQGNSEVAHLLQVPNKSNNNLQKNNDVEILQSQSVAYVPEKLQQQQTDENGSFGSQESQNILGSILKSGNGISAQIQDKIIGTIPHPSQDNKVVTYKKDESFYLYTNLDSKPSGNSQTHNQQANANAQSNGSPNLVSFQIIPSVGYQLNDEKEKQKFFDTFHIDEFGGPKTANLVQLQNAGDRQGILTSDINYDVVHDSPRQYNPVSNIYEGLSSYSAPQSSVGHLLQSAVQTNPSSRLEQLDDDYRNGYSNVTPARPFSF